MAIVSKNKKIEASATLADRMSGDRPNLLNLLFYGPPKRGKTVTAHGLPRTRTLDFDNGLLSLVWAINNGVIEKRLEDIVYRTILPPSDPKRGKMLLDVATDQVDDWIKEEDIPDDEWDRPYEKEWDTLIIDSATQLTEAAIMKGLREGYTLNLSKSWERYTGDLRPMGVQDWGHASQLFVKFIEQMKSLGKNVVLIAHEYHVTDAEGTITAITPNVIGQLRQKLAGMFDEVWYMDVKGSRSKPEYFIQTTPDTLRNLGSRLSVLDPVEPADFIAIRAKIAKALGKKPEELWQALHGKACFENMKKGGIMI